MITTFHYLIITYPKPFPMSRPFFELLQERGAPPDWVFPEEWSPNLELASKEIGAE
jgi:hypothetical protein